jgi:hypothetical protein
VIEANPGLPGGIVVTPIAGGAEFFLVRIVRPVAAVTGRIDFIRTGAGLVAGRAGEIFVTAGERKPGPGVVVEARILPAGIAMAILAFSAVRSGMNVILAVTLVANADGPAFSRFLVIDTVTGIAVGSAMFSRQRIAGVAAMIEHRQLPFLFTVAPGAVRSEAVGVNIPDRVTTRTTGRRILVPAVAMAALATHPAVRFPELEFGAVVIELGFSPAAGDVTLAAVRSQFPVVSVVLCMAIAAARLRIPILRAGLVTGTALGQRVFTGERKIGYPVVEPVAVQPDDAGVSSLVIGMTGFAFELVRVFILAVVAALFPHVFVDLFVAVPAKHWLRGIAHADMAQGALGFEFPVPGNQFSGHEYLFELQCRQVFAAGETEYQD